MDCELGEDLAVEEHSLVLGCPDEAAVLYSAATEGRVESCDPETAKIALLATPIAVRVLSRFEDCGLRELDGPVPPPAVPLRKSEEFLMPPVTRDTAFDSHVAKENN